MDSVANPVMFLLIVITRFTVNLVVISETTDRVQASCQPVDPTAIKCPMPPLSLPVDFHDPPSSAVATFVSTNELDRADIYMGFELDGETSYRNITATFPDLRIDFLPSPNVSCQTGDWQYNTNTDQNITITGSNLTRGNSLHDVHVTIGDGVCEVTQLTDDTITCQPPRTTPNNRNSTWCSADKLPVQVLIGYQSYECSCLQYVLQHDNSSGSSAPVNLPLIIGIAIASAAAVIVLVILIAVIYRARRQSKNPSNNWSSNGPRRFETWGQRQSAFRLGPTSLQGQRLAMRNR